MIYRIATKNDIAEIIKLKNEVKQRVEAEKLPIWLHGYPLDEFIVEDIQNAFGRVVVENETIVAYAAVYPALADYPSHTFKNDHVYSFGRIMVGNAYVGKHYGSFLVRNIIEEARKANVPGVGLLVDSCNQKALRLYEKYGFQKEGSAQFEFAYLDIYGLYF